MATKTRKKTRPERAEANRRALLRAAGEVVGEYGYRKASISRIAERAGLAEGTLYLYFKSRQDLFDQLLPYLGLELLDYVRERVRGSEDVLDIEAHGFHAFFEFLQFNPGFFRILNEAEVDAPKGHEVHFEALRTGYIRSLKRSWERGELPGYEERELEVISYILMAARSYLYLRYSKAAGGPRPLPHWVADTYMKFVAGGLRRVGPDTTSPEETRR